MSLRLPRLSSGRIRRAAAALALVTYVLSVVGMPIPVPVAKDTSKPFPCQGHECGCHTAAQCWESCCCYSPAQRVAWARRHGVSIPREVELAMACRTCDRPASAAADACCADDSHAAADDGCETCQQEQSGVELRFAYGFQAQKCQGLTTLWITSGTTVPVMHSSLWEYDWVQVGQVCPPARSFSSHVSTPPVPPPRPLAGGAPVC